MAEAKRVALLARPGAACERLQSALQEAGAELVLVADPTASDADGVRAAGAQAVLVALEPQVEDALDRFDAVLGDPDVTVIFDEAELAAAREGWDAARWVRHLAVKLGGRDDVLPPGAEPEEEASLVLHAEEGTPALGGLSLDAHDDLEFDFERFAAEAEAIAAALPQADYPGAGEPAGEPDFQMLADAPAIDMSDIGPLQTANPQVGGMSLQLEEEPAIAPDAAAVRERFHLELDDLEQRMAKVELAPPAPVGSDRGPRVPGAVVVLAGIGGPDAVRQLLSALPPGFPRPVLVQQRLDGARHDKLVRQMQRATSLPVALAEAGGSLQGGNIYVLPTGVLPAPVEGELRFIEADGPAFTRLPPEDSAILLLSGSDPAAVDGALSHRAGGATVFGQAPEGCFDDVAPRALVARGGESATPSEMAGRLAMRWLSLG
jgi:chemosensory pili system protein ChpB (putative protein-glutamate methylesterase)